VIAIGDGGAAPADVKVLRGGTVVWDNGGPSGHAVADGTSMTLFDHGTIGDGWWGSHDYVAAGVYRWTLDGEVAGSVTVPLTASPARGRASTKFTVTWASEKAPDGFAYDAQIRRPGRGWRIWKDDVTRPSWSFGPDAGKGGYQFRARLVKLADDTHAAWSPADRIAVR
jgi:hypothetical protein